MRPHQAGSPLHPNSEVKLPRVSVVLRWGTTREGDMLHVFSLTLSLYLVHSHSVPRKTPDHSSSTEPLMKPLARVSCPWLRFELMKPLPWKLSLLSVCPLSSSHPTAWCSHRSPWRGTCPQPSRCNGPRSLRITAHLYMSNPTQLISRLG